MLSNVRTSLRRYADRLFYACYVFVHALNSSQAGFLTAVSDFFSSLWRNGDEVAISSNEEENESEEEVERKPARAAEALVERGSDVSVPY